jgi:hypothetical protein
MTSQLDLPVSLEVSWYQLNISPNQNWEVLHTQLESSQNQMSDPYRFEE